MRISLEVGIKVHRFAGIFPEQFLTEAGRHREAMVAAHQRMVIRCFRDDLAGFVHDVSHVALQSNDRPALVQAMYPKPRIILRRPVGSSRPFKEQHELPTHLADFAHFTRRHFLALRQSLPFAGVLATRSLERGLLGSLNIHAFQAREVREATVLDRFSHAL
jgi:hypothetical protein